MNDQWYYEREFEAVGPFSGQQLANLAAAGTVLPTDTVWKDGVELGVLASKVRYLFPSSVAAAPATLAPEPLTQATLVPAGAQSVAKPASVEEPSAPKWEARYQPPVGRARAVAGKGVTIVAQDGTTVKYRMKCMTCSHEDRSWKTMNIPRGTVRVSFYCTKCRKQRQLEISGQIG